MKTISIVGAGHLGSLIAKEVLSRDSNSLVRFLVRDPTKVDNSNTRISIVPFDVTKATQTETNDALMGSFSVVSALQGGPDVIVEGQTKLMLGTKNTGACRFIASDYSYNLFTVQEGLNIASDWRRTFASIAEKENTDTFRTIHILNGAFADKNVWKFVGLFDNSQFTIWGEGDAKLDMTTWEDTAQYTAAVALDDASREIPYHFSVCGDSVTIRDLPNLYSKYANRPVQVRTLGQIEDLKSLLQKTLQEQPNNMYAWLPLMYAVPCYSGMGALPLPLCNTMYPDIIPETFADIVKSNKI